MSVRRRFVATTALVVGAVVALASVLGYLVLRDELRDQVDAQLTAQGGLLERFDGRRGRGPFRGFRRFPGGRIPAPGPRQGGGAPYVTLLGRDGRVALGAGATGVPVTEQDVALAAGGGAPALSDREAEEEPIRVLTAPLAGGGAVLLGRSLGDVARTLGRLRLVLVLLWAAAVGLAAALGMRAADRFVALLDRLEAARAAQRQLVADASHELRTPVTALRTNAELLLAREDLPAGQRRALLGDVVGQTEELSALVADLIELARGEGAAEEVQDVRLDALVAEAVERARRHAPGLEWSATLEPLAVDGVPERLGRAVNNLLDNAAKHSPPGGVVDVTLRGGALTVRDHGPGVPEAELPLLFDRFFRASNARDQPGSGLGLAIVKQVAERHGGTVGAHAAPGGGLEVRLVLPDARFPDG